MPTRDKGLHCKGRACIFLRWSSLLPRGREQATDPRAVPVVSLGPTSLHPLLHLLTHTQTQPSPPQRHTCETSSIELCQKNATLQTIPTVGCRQYPESICSTITLIWAIHRVCVYMRTLKSVKPPEIPGMGVSVSWQKKKNERRAKRNNVTDEHNSQHNASVAITDTRQRQRCFSLPSLCVSLTQQPYSTVQPVKHKHIHTNTTHTYVYKNEYSQLKDRFPHFLAGYYIFFIYIFPFLFLLHSLFHQSTLVVISLGEALLLGLVIDQSCGGISGTLGVTDLFDLDFLLDTDANVDVTPLLGGNMGTSAFLFSSQSFFTLDCFPPLLFLQ